MSSCQCEGCGLQFGAEHAAKDLERYHNQGPDRTTRLLLNQLKTQGVEGATLLDVGAGIGVIHHELLDSGAGSAIHVDATDANIEAAEIEAKQRGHLGRVTFIRGDFVQLANHIAEADIVTLDRVICCYDDMEQLVTASATKARRLYGAVYPRERWVNKLWVALGNFGRRMLRNPFRTYVHSTTAIDDVLRRHGLQRQSVKETFVWRVAVYARH
ncbi:MAG TPA: methyltransferase domain-containing protein [Gemmatimonadaceae bacterium]|nr:methyltransferase domain-containing protein [Gemmatimonadaceae bacterium]